MCVYSLRASSPIWVSPSRLRRSLARSRETRFTRPNRRACSQASAYTDAMPLSNLSKLSVFYLLSFYLL